MSYVLYLSMLLAGQDPIAPAPADPDGTAVEAPATDGDAAPADGDAVPAEGNTGDTTATEPGEDDMSDEEEAEDAAASMAKLKEIVDAISVTVRWIGDGELMDGVERTRIDLRVAESNNRALRDRQYCGDRSVSEVGRIATHQDQIGLRLIWNFNGKPLFRVQLKKVYG